MKLYSYCIPIDDGAAPNPYWGLCTLVICKPKIRAVAKVGDWIAGVGGMNVNGKDYSGKLVYTMKVTEVLTMKVYDRFCRKGLKEKIPHVRHKDYARRVGDCIYDFDKDPTGRLRPSVHNYKNKATDLGGKHALMSDHYYYFGINAIEIRSCLKSIINQGQSHKSILNEPVKIEFIDWIQNFGFKPNKLIGDPQIKVIFKQGKSGCISSTIRCNVENHSE